MAKKRKLREQGRPGFALMDEAVQLVRDTPISIHLLYYVGSLPFVAGLLTFWASMTYSAHAYAQLPGAALLMAILYLWMKAWQARHAAQLRAVLENQPLPPWWGRAFLATLARQSVLQASAVLVMPLALLALFPLGWAHAAYQNATVLDGQDAADTRELARQALREARRWPRQNHLLLWLLSPQLVCFMTVLVFLVAPVIENTAEDWLVVMLWTYVAVFGLAVFLLCPVGAVTYINICTGILILLYLVHTLLGLDTFYSRAPSAFLGSPFFVLVSGLTYLALDPFVKAAYVLRCFHANALADGADLRIWLGRLQRLRTPVAALAVVFSLLCAAPGTSAQETGAALPTPETLDAALDAELANARYVWRMPRVPSAEENRSFAARFFTWVGEETKDFRDKVKGYLKKLLRWFEQQFDRSGGGGGASLSRVGIGLKVLAGVLIVLLAVALLLYLRRALQKRSLDEAPAAESVAAVPDLEDEATQADALPEDEWLALAQRYADAGDFRLGMRALYLAVLAHLARHEYIRIARHKSNLDYRRELERRDPVDAPHQRAFAESTLLYECVWYGEHPAGREQFTQLHRYQHYLRFDPHAPGARLREAATHA